METKYEVYSPTYTPKQHKEMRLFHKACERRKINFDEYHTVCDLMSKFVRASYRRGKPLECSPPLLALSAIAFHRGDPLDKVVTRDLTRDDTVRFEVCSKRKEKLDWRPFK
jgi:hypothetical protein